MVDILQHGNANCVREEICMDKSMSQLVKGVAILTMLAHHFIVIPFSNLPYIVSLFGYACKICVAIYAVISGYGYFFTKEKTVKYGLKKICDLLKIYWFSLFTLFIPIALLNGWELTFSNLLIQLFGLLPNLNWFAWYVFFYIFCMLIMPIIIKYRMLRFSSWKNLFLIIIVPYMCALLLRLIPNYDSNVILRDLFTCFYYLPCFLIGYWFAENKIYENLSVIKALKNPSICIIMIFVIFAVRIVNNSIGGIVLDVFYAPLMICLINSLFKNSDCRIMKNSLYILGKYSTSIWFFHAVFFSTYVSDLFKPILKLISWPPLMFLWLVVLSFIGAVIYQKLLEKIESLFKKSRKIV